jgi:hypothetical protein
MTEQNGGGARGYVLFVWSPSGYTLREQSGEPPRVGEELEGGLIVTKLGVSPMPGDPRPCAYVMGKS